jgi:hypothetical protein
MSSLVGIPKKPEPGFDTEEIVTIEEFAEIFGTANIDSAITLQIRDLFKYSNSFARINPTAEEALSDAGFKLGERVNYAPGEASEDVGGEIQPGDVGSVVGVDDCGVRVRWDRLGKDISVYDGELGELGILEELADLASHQENFPMIKRPN